MQGGTSVSQSSSPNTSPSPICLPLPPRSPFSFSSFDWSRGMVIFMHHLGQQDGRTSSNYLKQTRLRLLEKLPLYSSSQNQTADWDVMVSKRDLEAVLFTAFDRVFFSNKESTTTFCNLILVVVWFWNFNNGGLVLFKHYHPCVSRKQTETAGNASDQITQTWF